MKVFSWLYAKKRAPIHISYESSALGFATPHEDNAAGRKRQETVDSWAGAGQPVIMIDNVPRSGFKITDDIKRTYWGGGNVVFRVLDPIGIELEIQSQNLMMLIREAGIDAGGEIRGKCLWGRDGAHNILLHETSEDYKNATTSYEKHVKVIPTKDLIVGGVYKTKAGNEYTYFGRFFVIYTVTPYAKDTSQEFAVKASEHYVDYDIVKTKDGMFESLRKFSPVELISTIELNATAENVTEQILARHGSMYCIGKHGGTTVAISKTKPSAVTFKFVETTRPARWTTITADDLLFVKQGDKFISRPNRYTWSQYSQPAYEYVILGNTIKPIQNSKVNRHDLFQPDAAEKFSVAGMLYTVEVVITP